MIQLQNSTNSCSQHNGLVSFKDVFQEDGIKFGGCVENVHPDQVFRKSKNNSQIKQEQFQQELETQTYQYKLIFEGFMKKLNKIKEVAYNNIENINRIISDSISDLENFQNEQIQLFQNNTITVLDQVQEQIMKSLNKFSQKQLSIFQMFSSMFQELNALQPRVEEFDIQNIDHHQKMKDNSDIKILRLNQNLICSIKQHQECCAIAINKDSSLVASGNSKSIRVFKLMNEKLNKKCEFRAHDGIISCLQFMNHSSHIVSASFDGKIKIWSQSGDGDRIVFTEDKILKYHKGAINCLIVGMEDYEIISGSENKAIILWNKKTGNWKISQELNVHKKAVISISLSKSQQKLISSGLDNQIFVFSRLDQSDNFIMRQTFQVNWTIWRLSFAGDDQFSYLTADGKVLIQHFYNEQTKQFLIGNKHQIQEIEQRDEFGLFPSKYIEGLNSLIIKHGKFLNCIKMKKNKEMEIQYFEFNCSTAFGTVNEQGSLLIVWKEDARQIEVLKM